MNRIALLTIMVLLSGCTVSARNHHFELEKHSQAQYDDFNNIWCFTASESDSVEMCSGSYWSKSQYIGFIFPVFPQKDRDSRLAYDIKRERIIELKNLNNSYNMVLSELNGISLCPSQYAKECTATNEITINSNSSVWLKVPKGESHQFNISIAGLNFKAIIKQFSESNWHLVTV